MTFAPVGDSAVVVTLGSSIDESTLLRVRSLVSALESGGDAGIVDVVPAYATVTVFYDVTAFPAEGQPPYERVCRAIAGRIAGLEHRWPDLVSVKTAVAERKGPARALEIPVCYGGEWGPDIGEVARHCAMAVDDVVALHSGGSYRVHAVGFAPGFPYLGGLSERLRTPRRATPRVSVPAGSVGIGWTQTGVYPLATPGGWQLIGRTPLALFQPSRTPPALLRVGDEVRFRAISGEEFAAWK